MRSRRYALLPLLLILLAASPALILNAGSPSFGGFVRSASADVGLSVDSLASHVTVRTGSGTLELHNPTSEAQPLTITVVGAPEDVSASFGSSGGDKSTLPAGAGDTVNVTGLEGEAVSVRIAVVRTGGILFPSADFPVVPTGH